MSTAYPSFPPAYQAYPPAYPSYSPPARQMAPSNPWAAQSAYGTAPTPAPPLAPAKSVRARHILVDTRQEADQLMQQLQMGADFGMLARQKSKCPSKREGGDLDFFERGQMVPAFDRVAFKLPVGAISSPVKTDFGYHLIQVTARR